MSHIYNNSRMHHYTNKNSLLISFFYYSIQYKIHFLICYTCSIILILRQEVKLVKKWFEKVNMPESLLEFADYIYTEFDQSIIQASDEAGIIKKSYPRSLLINLFQRGVLDLTEESSRQGINPIHEVVPGSKIQYQVASIDTRFEALIVHDKSYWLSIPEEIRKEINSRYIMSPDLWVPGMIQSYTDHGYYETILPIEYALEAVEKGAASHFYTMECNCNNYIGGCKLDKYAVCLTFTEKDLSATPFVSRGLAWKISREELLDALKYADSQGLIHKLSSKGGHFCNCCTDCCIHHLDGEKYNKQLKGGYLQTPYLIKIEEDNCVNCGQCISRCPFQALKSNGTIMTVDSELCWGCGVCRTECSQNALSIIHRK